LGGLAARCSARDSGDIEFNGKKYRIITEPPNIGSPEAPRAAVFVRGEKFLKRDERLAFPGETLASIAGKPGNRNCGLLEPWAYSVSPLL